MAQYSQNYESGGAPDKVEKVLEKMRTSLKRRGAEGIRGLARHFKICDTNKNGTLDQEEFQKCIRLNNLGLSSEETLLLMRHFDRDNSGDVGYEEFLRAVRGRLSPVRKQLVKKIFDVLDKCAAHPQSHRTQHSHLGRHIAFRDRPLLRVRRCTHLRSCSVVCPLCLAVCKVYAHASHRLMSLRRAVHMASGAGWAESVAT